jgi:2-oxoglutarate dehydrogenase complex dehydrogenase (E1) component-like enzyme
MNESVNKDLEKKVALEMLKCQAFDHFMAKKYVSLKRYGAEGAESLMAFFLQFMKSCAEGKNVYD